MRPPPRSTRNTTKTLKDDVLVSEDDHGASGDEFLPSGGNSDKNRANNNNNKNNNNEQPHSKQGGPSGVRTKVKIEQNVKRKQDNSKSVVKPSSVTIIGLLIKKEPGSTSNPKPSTASPDGETSNICVNCKNVWNNLKDGKCRACIRYAKSHNGQERPAHVIEFAKRKVTGDLNKNRLCTICHLKPIYYIGKCSACYDYARQHNGALRPARLIQIAQEKAMGTRKCIVCHIAGCIELTRRRCITCYGYFKNHGGEDRPGHLIKGQPKIMKEVLRKCSSCEQMTNGRVKKGLCNACYLYAGNHNGQPRPSHIVNKPEGPVYKVCIVCKISRLGARMRKGKCNTCYNFPRRHNGLERDTLLTAVKPTTCSVCNIEVGGSHNLRCGKCYKCYKYAVRHNGEAHPSTRELKCKICSTKLPTFCVTGKCLKCYMYAYRHKGEDRPPELFNVKTRGRKRRRKVKQKEASPDPETIEPNEVITDCGMTINSEPDYSETTTSTWEVVIKEEGAWTDVDDETVMDDNTMLTSEDQPDSLLKEESLPETEIDIQPGVILNCFHLNEQDFNQETSSPVKQEEVSTEETGDVSYWCDIAGVPSIQVSVHS